MWRHPFTFFNIVIWAIASLTRPFWSVSLSLVRKVSTMRALVLSDIETFWALNVLAMEVFDVICYSTCSSILLYFSSRKSNLSFNERWSYRWQWSSSNASSWSANLFGGIIHGTFSKWRLLPIRCWYSPACYNPLLQGLVSTNSGVRRWKPSVSGWWVDLINGLIKCAIFSGFGSPHESYSHITFLCIFHISCQNWTDIRFFKINC